MTRYRLGWDAAEGSAEHRIDGTLAIEVSCRGQNRAVQLTLTSEQVARMLAALDADRHEDAAAVLSMHVAQVARPTLIDWLASIDVSPEVAVVRTPPRAG